LGELSDYDQQILEEIAQFPASIGSSIENYRFREALNELMNLARLGNKYLTDTEPWKNFGTDPVRVATNLNISLQICANLAILGEPFLPFSADKVNNMLNINPFTWKEAGSAELLQAGHSLNTAVLLFEKIEDSNIQAQVQKLLDTKVANEAAATPVSPSKPEITYEDFGKIDLRVGFIL
jgi:methionyl-tRNA synthetase